MVPSSRLSDLLGNFSTCYSDQNLIESHPKCYSSKSDKRDDDYSITMCNLKYSVAFGFCLRLVWLTLKKHPTIQVIFTKGAFDF